MRAASTLKRDKQHPPQGQPSSTFSLLLVPHSEGMWHSLTSFLEFQFIHPYFMVSHEKLEAFCENQSI